MNVSSAKRIECDLKKLSEFGRTTENGVTRLPYTQEARNCVDYLKNLMIEIGMETYEDAVGNVFGKLEGEDSSLPAIMMGSHYDSVINGGNFDGIAGVVSAIEVARLIKQNNIKLKRSFIVVGFNEEEGLRFRSSYIGSDAMLGKMTTDILNNTKDKDGISIYQAIKDYGNDPELITSCTISPQKIFCFFELHIEQGPVLDMKKIQIGIVDCIVGIERYIVKVHGRADHSGTTPMNMRIDANEVACKVIATLPDCARSLGDGSVATVGFMRVLPGGMNIVPELVEFSVDLRSKNVDSLNVMANVLKQNLEVETAKIGATYEINRSQYSLPAYMSNELVEKLEQQCKNQNLSYIKMLSGAGHDAQSISRKIDTAMIFVPSLNGRSHCPVEFSNYLDIANACEVILNVVAQL